MLERGSSLLASLLRVVAALCICWSLHRDGRAFQFFPGVRGQLVVPAGGEALDPRWIDRARNRGGSYVGAGNEEGGGNQDLL